MNLSTFNFKMTRMLIALLSLFLMSEAAFRVYHFGAESIYRFWEYNPRAITDSTFVDAASNPKIGYKLSANKEGRFKAASLSVNSLGFRGDDNSTVNKPKLTYRITLLGASIDMGAGVSNKQTYAHRLEQHLNTAFSQPIEVQNHAVGGYKALQIETSFWANVDKFKPDLILLPLHPEFFNRVYQPIHLENSHAFCFEIRCHLQNFFFLKALMSYTRDLTKGLHKIGWFGDKKHWRPIRDNKNKKDNINSTKEGAIFKRFIDQLKEANYKVVVMRLPTLDSHSTQQKSGNANEVWDRWLNESKPTLAINTSNEIQSKISLNDSIYLGDKHPNSRVHSLYASAIFHSLSPFIGKALSGKEN